MKERTKILSKFVGSIVQQTSILLFCLFHLHNFGCPVYQDNLSQATLGPGPMQIRCYKYLLTFSRSKLVQRTVRGATLLREANPWFSLVELYGLCSR